MTGKLQIKCPFCGFCVNTNEPGDWWNSKYIPDGDLHMNCDICNKPFVVRISWEPSFQSMTEEQAEE